MQYRRLENDGSYVFGGGRNDFLQDKEAVAQAIKTRLLLFWNEWWENNVAYVPFFEHIAGVRNNSPENIRKTQLLIQDVIINTRDVKGVKEEGIDFNVKERTLYLNYRVDTVYGEVVIEGALTADNINLEVTL